MSEPRPLRPEEPARLGEYRLLGCLGEGGQGAVYLGESPSGARVAVKVLHGTIAGDAKSRERFLREVEAARQVPQFCTARVLDVGTDGDRPYVVSEFIEGESLEARVTARGPLDPRDLERLAISTATALAAIHRAGIVHRDFKPANVLLGPDGPRVVDFGIARSTDLATTSVSVVGTPPYMSPEQLSGERVGPPSDMFSWAGTILFAGTGRLPFGRDLALAALVYRILNEPSDLTGLPDGLRPVVERCMAKAPEQRPTAEQVLMELITGGGATRPGPPPTGDLLTTALGRVAQPPTLPQTQPPVQPAAQSPVPPPHVPGPPYAAGPPRLPTTLPAPDGPFTQEQAGATPPPTDPSWGTPPPVDPSRGAALPADPSWGTPPPADPSQGAPPPVAPFHVAQPATQPSGRAAPASPGLSRRGLLIGGGAALATAMVAGGAVLAPRYLTASSESVTPPSPVPESGGGVTPTPGPASASPEASPVASPAASAAASPTPSRLIPLGLGGPLVLENGNLVQGLAISADGRLVATGVWDGTIRLWEIPTGELIAKLKDRERYVEGLALSPDGRTLVSVGGVGDTEAHFWDVASRKRIGKPVVGSVFAAFSPDGGQLVTGSGYEWVRLWRTSDRKQVGAALRHGELAKGAAFSPDGSLLATASWDRAVRLWRTSDGKAVGGPLKGHKDEVNAVVFLDGRTLASAGYDNVVRVWDVASRKPAGAAFKGSESLINGLALSPDGTLLAAATDRHGIWLWDVATRRPLKQPVATGQFQTVAFSANGLVLAAVTGNDVQLYDVGSLRTA